MSDLIAISRNVRDFFENPNGRYVLDKLIAKRVSLLEAASNKPKDEAFELLKEAKGVQTAIAEINTLCALAAKKGGKTL